MVETDLSYPLSREAENELRVTCWRWKRARSSIRRLPLSIFLVTLNRFTNLFKGLLEMAPKKGGFYAGKHPFGLAYSSAGRQLTVVSPPQCASVAILECTRLGEGTCSASDERPADLRYLAGPKQKLRSKASLARCTRSSLHSRKQRRSLGRHYHQASARSLVL